ncbi:MULTISPECIES: beta-propeller fold lactonase family protein [unclassified Enterobacter]|uniref:lactonase family protein n=1 Tax=unclassified Enterobacter TaxID=2608935 RepID=UPI0017A28B80|nr:MULTISPECIES: beta-propeller fold lactonase family protein [unclassified Enterobacter]MBB3303926.1 6-phosphogluconolactonase [Enterobacter sp. Sphag1F]NYI12969.1 6-phosphogluconolactonase [Enterobacter sp. Sphag71]
MDITSPLSNQIPKKKNIATAILASLCLMPYLVNAASATEEPNNAAKHTKTMVYVGTYSGEGSTGGIYSYEMSDDGKKLTQIQHIDAPAQAGFQVVNQKNLKLYSVDERKNDGRGPVSSPAKVYSFSIDKNTGKLIPLNSMIAPGPNPTYLSIDAANNRLFTANHGGFEHIEKVVFKEGKWQSAYDYDDATVIMYKLKSSGELENIKDLVVLKGHGQDPNNSKQLAGHAQASSHAHSSVVSPDGKYLLVCNKGTDEILVYAIRDKLKLVNSFKFPDVSAPRHLVFTDNKRFYLDLELSNQVASMNFDPVNGKISLIDKVSAVPPTFDGYNEPAEIRLHPNHKYVYVNNRGSDDISWFGIQPNGKLEWKGSVPLAKSLHPGVAARSFALSPDAQNLIVADRPDNKLKIYSINANDGSLKRSSEVPLAQPAFISFALLN